MIPCANVGIKPWHLCGCTDDTPCRLGDAGSMSFLPWFFPRTEPPVQHREVGPDRGYLLTQSCSDVHLHVRRCRTGDEGCCCCSVGTRHQNITACTVVTFARSKVLPQRVLQQHRVLRQHVLLLLLLLMRGVVATRGGGGPQEAIRLSRWWSRIV